MFEVIPSRSTPNSVPPHKSSAQTPAYCARRAGQGHPSLDQRSGAKSRISTRTLLIPLLILALPCLCQAQTPAPDTTATSTPDSTKYIPRSALLRSALLPGWGQFYNKRPLKGLFFGAAALGLLSSAIAENRSLGQAQTPSEHELRADRRNTRFLFLGLVATFAGLDAYVDAHLDDFTIEPDIDLSTGTTSLHLVLSWDMYQSP